MLQFESTKLFNSLREICLGENKIVEKIMDHLDVLIASRSSLSRNIKAKGYSPSSILKTLFILPYLSLPNVASIYKSGLPRFTAAGKDVFYEFKNNNRINWRNILNLAVKKYVKIVHERTEDPKQQAVQCLIVDDTTCEKTGKRIEMIGRVFDHVTQNYVLGFKILVLGYWDGKSFLPVDFSIHGEKGKNPDKPQGMEKKDIKKRFQMQRPQDSCPANVRVDEYFMSKLENAVCMIKRAVKNGLKAQYVLADSWFMHEPFINGIRDIKKGSLHVLGMCSTNKKFNINGKSWTTRALIAIHNNGKKTNRKFKLQYFTLYADYKGIEVKLFFVKQGYGNNNDNWKLIITTDLSLSFQKAIETYQIRWTIEVFFKDAKQNLYLGKSQSNYFNAQIADTTICLMQYILLALLKRFECYETLGGAFRDSQRSMLQATLADRILEIFLHLMKELVELLELDYEMIMEKLLHKDSSAKIIAILNALRDDDLLEETRKAA
jgi:hypothetical protein